MIGFHFKSSTLADFAAPNKIFFQFVNINRITNKISYKFLPADISVSVETLYSTMIHR